MSCPGPKHEKTIDQNVEDKEKAFYNSDDMSPIRPYKKDFVATKLNGKDEHMQKRLLLMSLNECNKL